MRTIIRRSIFVGVFVASSSFVWTIADAAPISQYATSATASSQYETGTTGDGTPGAAVGAPDQTVCGDTGPTWQSLNGNNNEQTVTLTFATAVVPSQIKIWMALEPRALVKVEARNGTGAWLTVLTRAITDTLSTGASCLSGEVSTGPVPHTLTSSNATFPSTAVNQIRLTFNEGEVNETFGMPWGGVLDAVQLTGTAAVAKPANSVAPSISGRTRMGDKLTATKGTWTGGAPITYAYAWVVCNSSGAKASSLPSGCTLIGGATSSTYTLGTKVLYKYLRVRVAATNSGGTTYVYSATSAKTCCPKPEVRPGE